MIKRVAILISLFILSIPFQVFSQNVQNDLNAARQKELRERELHNIEFVGNVDFSDSELMGVVSSKPTDLSIPHSLIDYYYNNLKENPATPKFILRGFRNNLEQMSYEIRYFSKDIAEEDVISLWHYYNQHGFHHSDIEYAFIKDTSNDNNTLFFYINRGNRYKIDTVQYLGLDSLPSIVLDKINNRIEDRGGDFFNENAILEEIATIKTTLLNNGYYFADVATPVVLKDTLNLLDSVLIPVKPGNRMVFGEISFVDSRLGQPEVVYSKKRQQVVFDKGEYYSRRKVNQSVDNLLGLGTFNIVSIDTFNVASAPSDTVLPMRVYLQYTEQQDIGIAPFVNKTLIDELWNTGIEATYLHRNIFGKAQTLDLRGSWTIKDISSSVNKLFENTSYQIQNEWSAGFTFSWPTIFKIDNTPVDFAIAPSFSDRSFYRYFNIRTVSIPTNLNIKLSSWTFINRITFDWILETQDPYNFDPDAIVTDSLNPGLKNRIIEGFYIFRNLKNYLDDSVNTHILTSNIIGVSLISEHRNKIFTPTDGYYINLTLDGINPAFLSTIFSGIAQYGRGQLSFYNFLPLQPNLTFATKFRAGTVLFDDSTSYVPIERQFFAGGANSNRGWYARNLRYTVLEKEESITQDFWNFYQDFVGNHDLIEISLEMRYRFMTTGMVEGVYVEQLSPWGVTGFVDIGNSFRWFIDDSTEVKWSDYFTKLAVGVGAGLRYNTPVGPVRLDIGFPIYGPFINPATYTTIWNRGDLKLEDLRFHLGLGHAF